MSLLDELRLQAEKRKAEEEQLRLDQERRHALYLEKIVPRMQEAFTYLKQLCEHLNYLKTEVTAYYPILGDGHAHPLTQQEYNVLIDSNNQPKAITLRFSCKLDEPLKYVVYGQAQVEHIAEKLRGYRIPHHCKESMDANYKVTHANVKIEGPLPVTFVMQADIDNTAIRLMYSNFEAPGVKNVTLQPEQVNTDLLEQLGKFILRENDNFMKLDMSSQEKEQIRLKLEEEKIRRQQEMEEMERLRLEEEAREKEQRGWRNKLKLERNRPDDEAG